MEIDEFIRLHEYLVTRYCDKDEYFEERLTSIEDKLTDILNKLEKTDNSSDDDDHGLPF